jgi:formylglycine-generating enzyme
MTRRILVSTLLLVSLASCKRGEDKPSTGQAGVASGAASAASPAAAGPQVKIAAGTLKAGTPWGGTPRITTEELVGESITMGEFTIDVLPYPNDPTKPVRVDVSRDEAAALCVEAGKRLCTELEWERACKGPSNTTFEYGQAWSNTHCKPAADLLPDKRPKCVSGFGVKDLHGLVFEWTSSAWGRGTSGDLATVRGGPGTAGVLQARCANGQSREPSSKGKDVGFRCCSGPANPAAVGVTLQRQAPMVEEPSVEAGLATAMLKAMPADHRSLANVDVGFDKVWRWHPRDNEELLIGRWTGKPKDNKGAFHELAVFKVCGNAPALIARMRGPAAKVQSPGAGGDAQKVSAAVGTGTDSGDVKLSYWYGSVNVENPSWLKAGNSVDVADKPDKPVTKVLRPRLKPR